MASRNEGGNSKFTYNNSVMQSGDRINSGSNLGSLRNRPDPLAFVQKQREQEELQQQQKEKEKEQQRRNDSLRASVSFRPPPSPGSFPFSPAADFLEELSWQGMDSTKAVASSTTPIPPSPQNFQQLGPEVEDAMSFRRKIGVILEASTIGVVVDFVNSAASVLSVIMFLISTYHDYAVFGTIEDVLLLFYCLDYLIRFLTAEDFRLYFFSSLGFVDVVTIIPGIIDYISSIAEEGKSFVNLTFFRMFRVLRILRLLRLIRKTESSSSSIIFQQGITLLLWTASALFIGAGILRVCEVDFPSTPSRTQTFHDWLYYVVVLVSGTGYGDIVVTQTWSKLIVFIVFAVVIAMVGSEVNKFTALLSDNYHYRSASYISGGRKHVIICGILDDVTVADFFSEFYHPDHGANDTDVVAVSPLEPSAAMKAELNRKDKFARVMYIQGDITNPLDLMRADVQSAKLIFILADKLTSSPMDADLITILYAMTMKQFLKRYPIGTLGTAVSGSTPNSTSRPRLVIQLLQSDSQARLYDSDAADQFDIVMSLSRMRHNIQAKSVICPGFSTLIYNVVTSSRGEVEKLAQHANIPSWIKEYARATDHELYHVLLPKCCVGVAFNRLAEMFYGQLKGVLMIGIEVEDDRFERKVVLNPGKEKIPDREVWGLVIAEDHDAASRIETFDVPAIERGAPGASAFANLIHAAMKGNPSQPPQQQQTSDASDDEAMGARHMFELRSLRGGGGGTGADVSRAESEDDSTSFMSSRRGSKFTVDGNAGGGGAGGGTTGRLSLFGVASSLISPNVSNNAEEPKASIMNTRSRSHSQESEKSASSAISSGVAASSVAAAAAAAAAALVNNGAGVGGGSAPASPSVMFAAAQQNLIVPRRQRSFTDLALPDPNSTPPPPGAVGSVLRAPGIGNNSNPSLPGMISTLMETGGNRSIDWRAAGSELGEGQRRVFTSGFASPIPLTPPPVDGLGNNEKNLLDDPNSSSSASAQAATAGILFSPSKLPPAGSKALDHSAQDDPQLVQVRVPGLASPVISPRASAWAGMGDNTVLVSAVVDSSMKMDVHVTTDGTLKQGFGEAMQVGTVTTTASAAADSFVGAMISTAPVPPALVLTQGAGAISGLPPAGPGAIGASVSVMVSGSVAASTLVAPRRISLGESEGSENEKSGQKVSSNIGSSSSSTQSTIALRQAMASGIGNSAGTASLQEELFLKTLNSASNAAAAAALANSQLLSHPQQQQQNNQPSDGRFGRRSSALQVVVDEPPSTSRSSQHSPDQQQQQQPQPNSSRQLRPEDISSPAKEDIRAHNNNSKNMSINNPFLPLAKRTPSEEDLTSPSHQKLGSAASASSSTAGVFSTPSRDNIILPATPQSDVEIDLLRAATGGLRTHDGAGGVSGQEDANLNSLKSKLRQRLDKIHHSAPGATDNATTASNTPRSPFKIMSTGSTQDLSGEGQTDRSSVFRKLAVQLANGSPRPNSANLKSSKTMGVRQLARATSALRKIFGGKELREARVIRKRRMSFKHHYGQFKNLLTDADEMDSKSAFGSENGKEFVQIDFDEPRFVKFNFPLAVDYLLKESTTNLVDHIIVAGDPYTTEFVEIIAPLRARFLKKQVPIVLLVSEAEGLVSQRSKFAVFPHVHVIEGLPTLPRDLYRAGVRTARAVVIVGSAPKLNESLVSDVGELVLDSASVFAYNVAKHLASTENPNLSVIVEFLSHDSLFFLSSRTHEEAASLPAKRYTQPALASGEAVLARMVDAITCQSYFNPLIYGTIMELAAPVNHAIYIDGREFVGSLVTCVPILPALEGRPYRDGVLMCCQRGEILLGLLRTPVGAVEAGEDDRQRVLTNPDGGLVMRHGDFFFILSLPTISYKNEREANTKADEECKSYNAWLAEANKKLEEQRKEEEKQQKMRQRAHQRMLAEREAMEKIVETLKLELTLARQSCHSWRQSVVSKIDNITSRQPHHPRRLAALPPLHGNKTK